MKLFILLFFIPFFSLAQTIQVEVPGMTCKMCVRAMQKAFKSSVEKVSRDVKVDLQKKVVTVKLKENLTDAQIRAIVGKTEYKAKAIKRINTAN